MPRRRPPRPFRPKPTLDDLIRLRLQRAAQRRRELCEAWRDAVVRESWRLVYAEGGNRCGAGEFARGRQSLIDQGFEPPPGLAEIG
jgi:hypothetical protein